MKSKILKSGLAIMLCMVIVLSGSGYLSAVSLQDEKKEEVTEPEKDQSLVEVEIPKENKLTYEDKNIKVTVKAVREDSIPSGAGLSVTPIEKKKVTADMDAQEKAETEALNKQYDLTEKKLKEKAKDEERQIEGFLAYDISLVDANGKELEPTDDVKVSMEYKKAVVPEEVKKAQEKARENNQQYEPDITVMHLEENAKGEVKKVVDLAIDQEEEVCMEKDGDVAIEKAEFVTDSFSVYTVVWKNNTRKAYLHFVDENGKDISGTLGVINTTEEVPDKGNIDLNEVANKYEGTKGYFLSKACLDTQTGTVADKISYNNNGNGYWHYHRNGWIVWKTSDAREVQVYLIFKQEPELSTAETLDHTSAGITMRLIDLGGDYDKKIWKDENNKVDFGEGSGYGDGTIKKDLLQSKLDQNGYPVTVNGNTNLSTLFASNTTVNHLFRKDIYDSTGYYEYSCFENYAYLDQETNNFTVYNQLGTPSNSDAYYYQRGNFMPFNAIARGKYSTNNNLYDEDGKLLTGGRKDERLYKTQGTNYQFGMYIDADFTQLKDGKVTHNGTKKSMIYEFNGDDDLWVYIDGVLVLDIGGVHDAHSGKIDFSTGNVTWMDGETGKTQAEESTTIKALFKEAGVFPDGSAWVDANADQYFEGNTLKDYSTHKFQMFYLERGGGASNLHVKFNLPVIPKNTVNVQKIVEDEDGNPVDYADDIDFKFKMMVDGLAYANQPYVIVKDGQETERTGTTDANGCFTLKHLETARFKEISEDKNYQVQELGAYLNGYEVQVNGVTVKVEDSEGSGTATPAVDSGLISVATQPTAVFTNTVKNRATLSIKKTLASGTENEGKTFRIRLKLNGELYTQQYTIGDNQYTCENGILLIKAGETATISGLPYGITFDVEEMLDGSYLPTYTVTESSDAVNVQLPEYDTDGVNTNDVYSASAQMAGNCEVDVTNEKVVTGTGVTNITVSKNWDDSYKYELPPYVDVTLYVDVNSNGEYDEGTDTPVAGVETKRLNADNNWTAQWINQAADTDFVVKETYPEGYELYTSSVDNSLTEIVQVGGRNTPNNNTKFNIGKNNILLVKETGDSYFLWSPIDLKLDQSDIASIVVKIKEKGLEGAGNLDNNNISYQYGLTNQSGISLTENENGWTLSFDKKSNWVMFWDFSYTRDEAITLTNTIDTDHKTSLTVKKEWVGDKAANRPTKITVQLYQNGNAYGDPVEITQSENWSYTFENLPFYSVSGDQYIKNKYTAKEISIINGSDETQVQDGMAGDYQVSEKINEDGSVTITNTIGWQILKVSANSEDYKLEGAWFELTKKDDSSKVYYGMTGEDGIVSWYKDIEHTTSYEGSIPDGEYELKETKAPNGYAVNVEIWTIRVDKGQPSVSSSSNQTVKTATVDHKTTFYFTNTPVYSLPSAGGIGIFWYTFGGMLLMMAAALMLYKSRLRNR